jgi:putative ABC transport system permease protein
VAVVSRGFASTLGIPLRAGRNIEQQEIDRAAPVALVNERAARLLWPTGTSPIGARLRLGILANPRAPLPMAAGATPEVTIMGILADSRMDDHLGIAGGPLVFLPDKLVALSSRTILVRTAGPPILLWDAVQREIRSLDHDQAAGSPWVVEGDLSWDENRTGTRFDMALFGLVGLIGLALAAAGICCVLSYTVTRRTHEVGIRMALGATRGQVLRLVLLMGARLVAMGLALGLPGTFAISSMVEGDVPKAGAWSVLAIMLALVPVALLACYVPARRAICSNPSVALRHD